ncbi:MAG: AAA family ATPase [Porticoccaceae bacterium]
MSAGLSRLPHDKLDAVVSQVGSVLLGKHHQIRMALCCLLARGHLLIEDLPGMGKTTLAHGLAASLGLSFKRIQFTSDLLPGDILGISVYHKETEKFRFHPGPIFTQLLLADEINRTTPKTQSALLEAMGEGQVTIDGKTRHLPQPFFVVATQNPVFQGGTYPLPESQQDRFAMSLSLGYPDRSAEKNMLMRADNCGQLDSVKPCLSPEELVELQNRVARIHLSEPLADYLVRLVQFTRSADSIDCGLSPRASLSLLACARAWALLEGRDYVIPEDVQTVFPAVARHRLQIQGDGRRGAAKSDLLVEQALNEVDTL